MPMRPTYSTFEVAQRLGVSVQTVQRWVDMGHLPAWKTLGGHRRIDATSADTMFHERDLTAASRAAPAPRVLVVDDNPTDRRLVERIVKKVLPNAFVVTVANGFEALVTVGREVPDVLIADLVLPHINGVRMLSHLAADPGARPALMVAMSSRPTSELATLGQLPECVTLMPKPIDKAALAALLQEKLLLPNRRAEL